MNSASEMVESMLGEDDWMEDAKDTTKKDRKK